MEYIKRNQIKQNNLPGRIIQKAVGKDGFIKSNRMTMGFAYYSERCGIMEPHHHAEETVYIVDCKGGSVRYGKDINSLNNKTELEPGMILHFKELEWHVFEFNPKGFVDIIFFYGQIHNIRPEEILKMTEN